MKRRNFVVLAGGVAAWPLVARAQRPSVPVVGFLSATSPESYATFVNGFQRGLREAGFVDGDNVATITAGPRDSMTGCRGLLPIWSPAMFP
jgi:putative tryptophan/tyrosine transport system substrate-binding protein